jgi:transcriptional regulator with PAS, ATPase and Fis domain
MLMISYTQTEREKLLSNTSALLEFISEMATLLCSKIKEFEVLEQEKVMKRYLEAIINSIDSRIISIDNQGTITQINSGALEILNLNKMKTAVLGTDLAQLLPRKDFEPLLTRGEIIKRQEVSSRFPRCFLSGNPIKVNGQVVGAVIVLEGIEEVRPMSYEPSAQKMECNFDDIYSRSQRMREVKDDARCVAVGDSTVLIQGESGTGKELFARAIHCHSRRSPFPFIPINCAAIPEALLESELFGYEEGAFTGARRGGKPGKFELASKGTVFLDEIGDIPLHLQVKLLRVLQERCIEKVGGVKPIHVDVRVIAATNQDLNGMVGRGTFREDLFYRLNVVPLRIPPLRDRQEDIMDLAGHFLAKFVNRFGKDIEGFSSETQHLLLNYHWPGNVRQLENAVECSVNMEKTNLIQAGSLPSHIGEKQPSAGKKSLKARVDDLEEAIIRQALASYGSTVEGKRLAAEELGISLPTLYRKMGKVAT